MGKERCLVFDPPQAKEAFLSQALIQNANGGTLYWNSTISLSFKNCHGNLQECRLITLFLP